MANSPASAATQPLQSDVRIIAATNKNLEQEVVKKTFREDLFYRLNVVRIVTCRRSRQRVEDIRLLAEYFLQKAASQKHLPKLKLSEEAVRVLEAYPWPGNVRELENTIQRASVLATSDLLLPKDIPLGASYNENMEHAGPVAASAPAPAVAATADGAIEVLLKAAQVDPNVQLLPWLEREFTLYAIKATKGNQVKAARLLGVTRATLRKRLDRFNISADVSIKEEPRVKEVT